MTSTPLARDRIQHLVQRMRSSRVAVVGDVMLDRYLVGDTDRLSPEAPVPVVTVRERRRALGGAANVAANAAAVGAECVLVGVVGDDEDGLAVRQELAAAGLTDSGLVAVADRPTTCKTRVLARGQQLVRIDEEIETDLAGRDLERLIGAMEAAVAEADVVLLEDYNKGVLAPAAVTAALEAAERRGVPVVVDPKFRRFFSFTGATVFKPNRRELEAALGAAVDFAHQDALPEALARLGVKHLLVTLGADGMLLVEQGGRTRHIPSLARAVFDVSGAGDTVTAWLGTAMAAGATVLEAAQLASYAAGIEVGKVGVATVSPDEVLAIHDELHDPTGRLRRGGLL
jgi:D-beta-D-heptose 7-phosphate kinase/D-beta-D-heptose 1-phosphate adenosyltransferase